MSENKTFVFDGNGSQSGFDPNLMVGAMMGGGGFGGFGGGNWLLPFLLFALWGNGGFGFGRGGALNNDAGLDLITQGIQGNQNAINQLANMLNCDVAELRNALSAISGKICDLGNQVGMSTLQVIQAINTGNSSLQMQLAQCCCDIKGAIADNKYATERGFCNTNQILSQGFSSVAYETQRQTCDLQNSIKDSTAQILAGQAAIEKRELQREIDTLREQKETYKLGNMITAATAPILNEVEAIKCKLPKTETIVATPDYVPINRGINVNYAPYGCGIGFGFGGWNGNCNNAFAWG